jgi:hypothetical protein
VNPNAALFVVLHVFFQRTGIHPAIPMRGRLSLENALDGVNMRKPVAASAAARKTSGPSGSRDNAPAEVVCMALVLALVVLALRIASIW